MVVNLLSVIIASGVTGACGKGDEGPPYSGTNLEANDVKIRYAHLAEPEDADQYRVGADVPMYMWLVNGIGTSQAVTSVTSPVARTVALTGGALPVPLPSGQAVLLGPNGRHFVLQDLTRELPTEEYIPVTMTFANGARVTFDVEAYDVEPSLLTATPTR